VNGGFDVNVRQLAADGVQVVGAVIGASGGTLSIRAGANQILDLADTAYADFVSAARLLVTREIDEELAEESLVEPTGLPAAIDEMDSLDLVRKNIATIIWATGYTYDFDWVKIPVFDERGRPVQQRGVTHLPGLYFLGLHLMHTFKSGLFASVGSDAEYLAAEM
jgi:putative flavoprotein involved in K+ transport